MGKVSWAQSERKELATLLDEVGPDAPTLCGDWTTRDLAAHMVARESRPDAAAGISLKFLSGWTEKVQSGYAEKPWGELVDALRNGPPAFSGFRLPGADTAFNTVEYFVHHEDVRRAQPGWQPRELDPLQGEELWKILRSRSAMFFRHAPMGVLLKREDGRQGQTLAHPGSRRVTIAGPTQELLMYALGRKDHALVKVEGDPEDVAAINAANNSA